jgi:energy-coupling factor transporter ATP-binding protein EcfA2
MGTHEKTANFSKLINFVPMNATLIIKNFGPIRDLNIYVKKFNILIGPHASGKSTLSKVLAIIHSFDFNVYSVATEGRRQEILRLFLVRYRIENFLRPDTYWFFEDEVFSFELKSHEIIITHRDSLENTVKKVESYYLPAERVALPMINESLFELTESQSSLPGYFLQFGRDFTIARNKQQQFQISALGVEYKFENGENRVYFGNQSLLLQETSSAIQANLPLLVILQYPINIGSLFVVEELELHGYPLLQKKLLYYLIERLKHPKLKNAYVVLPTHSPYILSAANNLLFAAKVASQVAGVRSRLKSIIPEGSWIEINDFSAYYMEEGIAKTIVDPQSGLIDENALDSISEDLAGEFDQLMALYKPATA